MYFQRQYKKESTCWSKRENRAGECLQKQKEILQKAKQITNKYMVREIKQHTSFLRHQARTQPSQHVLE